MTAPHDCVDSIRSYYEQCESIRNEAGKRVRIALRAWNKAKRSKAPKSSLIHLETVYRTLMDNWIRAGYVGD